MISRTELTALRERTPRSDSPVLSIYLDVAERVLELGGKLEQVRGTAERLQARGGISAFLR